MREGQRNPLTWKRRALARINGPLSQYSLWRLNCKWTWTSSFISPKITRTALRQRQECSLSLLPCNNAWCCPQSSSGLRWRRVRALLHAYNPICNIPGEYDSSPCKRLSMFVPEEEVEPLHTGVHLLSGECHQIFLYKVRSVLQNLYKSSRDLQWNLSWFKHACCSHQHMPVQIKNCRACRRPHEFLEDQDTPSLQRQILSKNVFLVFHRL